MEIDHIYICTETKAPVGDLLKEFGLVEGSSNTHPGQGTASRRFYFHNLMLELLWIENLEEVQSERTKPMRLYERCLPTTSNVSPFGVAFRPTTEISETAPFPAWDYHPIYLPDFLKIQVADNTPLSEPMYFYLTFTKRQDEAHIAKREPMEHKVVLKEVTSVKIHVNQKNNLSEPALMLNRLHNLSIEQDKEHLIELEFDNGTLNQSKDFRPDLPLLFKW
ncbi:MAG TPA: hypothetical protein VEB00_00750 [Clostridia bacterium]|nr:hypothetical protein [Clostridia bacterium]